MSPPSIVSRAARSLLWAASVLAAVPVRGAPLSAACKSCHETAYAAWEGSHHARANRLFSPEEKRAAEVLRDSAFDKLAALHGRPGAFVGSIGVSPLAQYLVALPGGRYQAYPVARDTSASEWVDTTEVERGGRVPQPGTWGHWQGKGLNWNSQCAFCHTTEFRKGYDPEKDSYESRWVEQGVGCAQCHTNLEEHLREPGNRAIATSPNARLILDNCASCHSRREELDGDFKPGESFFDHFRLQTVDTTVAHFQDGQVRDEDFEYGAFRLSRMGQAGVQCLDCHDAHTGKTKMPARNDALCQQCHGGSKRLGAPVIQADKHRLHKEGQPGSACVDCHMPQTVFMQRHARRDHGFHVPDPALTEALQIPNACNRCHADKSPAWAAERIRVHYGERATRSEQRRTLAIDRAQLGDRTVLPELVGIAKAEVNSAWRAVLVGHLEGATGDAGVLDVVKTALEDQEPEVRVAAVRALALDRAQIELLKAKLKDPSKGVRIEAAEALLQTAPELLNQEARDELQRTLENLRDQPAGALRYEFFLKAVGR